MKKALLLGFISIFGCDVTPSESELAEKQISKNAHLKDCVFETVATTNKNLYIIRCPLSSTSVNWIRQSGKFRYPETTITIEDTVPKEDPKITALKEEAEKLGYKVEKK